MQRVRRYLNYSSEHAAPMMVIGEIWRDSSTPNFTPSVHGWDVEPKN